MKGVKTVRKYDNIGRVHTREAICPWCGKLNWLVEEMSWCCDYCKHFQKEYSSYRTFAFEGVKKCMKYETLKILESLKECHPKTIIKSAGVRNVGNYTMWIEKDTVENVRVGLFYLLYDIGLELGLNVNKGRLEKEIFGRELK